MGIFCCMAIHSWVHQINNFLSFCVVGSIKKNTQLKSQSNCLCSGWASYILPFTRIVGCYCFKKRWYLAHGMVDQPSILHTSWVCWSGTLALFFLERQQFLPSFPWFSTSPCNAVITRKPRASDRRSSYILRNCAQGMMQCKVCSPLEGMLKISGVKKKKKRSEALCCHSPVKNLFRIHLQKHITQLVNLGDHLCVIQLVHGIHTFGLVLVTDPSFTLMVCLCCKRTLRDKRILHFYLIGKWNPLRPINLLFAKKIK